MSSLPPMIHFAFFGSSRFSVTVLNELEKLGILPALVVTTPDKPKGRKLELTPNPVKVWATQRNIAVLDPAAPDAQLIERLKIEDCALFLVASYGKIIPKAIIEIPPHKTLNIHPSLLPRYRGASPLQTAMLDDAKNTGVTIMRIDEKMDHGPIVAQKEVSVTEWPEYEKFEDTMARAGADLLAEAMPRWIEGSIKEREQDHEAATYTKKIAKEDGLIDLSADPYLNFRKIQAYHEWPQAYFMIDRAGKQMKVKVTEAAFQNGKLEIQKVIPEGSKEMAYADFIQGYVRQG